MPLYRVPNAGAVAVLAKIPFIPATRDRTELYRRLRTLLDRSSRSKLLSILKYITYIVLLLNFGSLPFVWHIRVFLPILALKVRYWATCCKFVFASKKKRTLALCTWGENFSHVGASPFQVKTVSSRWATIDDLDAFGHLSNSSYAKSLDSARIKALVNWFPAWGRSKGQMALGATHYHFLREIAPLVRYEIRLTIDSWDHKWIYVVARFVTRPSRRRPADRSPQSSAPPTPADAPTATFQNGSADIQRAVAAVIQNKDDNGNGVGRARGGPILEPDGAILHCVAVSQLCFKRERITVPPAVVLASEGFTKPSDDDGVRPYSHANPPPNWIKSQALRVPPRGSMDEFRSFLRGRWRDVPEGERWWEDALGGSIETKRQANLEILESLRHSLERIRML